MSPAAGAGSLDIAAPSLLEARRRWPVKAWIVTDGPHAVWLIDENGQIPEPIRPLRPSVKEISATGSGDVLLACALQARLNRALPLARRRWNTPSPTPPPTPPTPALRSFPPEPPIGLRAATAFRENRPANLQINPCVAPRQTA